VLTTLKPFNESPEYDSPVNWPASLRLSVVVMPLRVTVEGRPGGVGSTSPATLRVERAGTGQ
jgi:hypothetical protein